MRYNMKKFLSTSALALILNLGMIGICQAQGVVSLVESAKSTNQANKKIPDEISLFGDDSADVLTPSKSARIRNTEPKDNAIKNAKVVKTETKTETVKTVKTNTVSKNVPAPVQAKQVAPQPIKQGISLEAPAENNKPAPLNAVKLQTPASTASKTPQAQEEAKPLSAAASKIDTSLVADIDDSVFDEMSNIEKETAILNLELKKEQVKNSIEALKAVQNKARQAELDKLEEKRKKDIEWRNEQKKKLLQEEQKLKNLEILFEQKRQEQILGAYKNKMLEEMQKNIADKASIYAEINKMQDERKKLISNFKGRFIQLKDLANEANAEVIRVRDAYSKTISDLQTEISILKARLEAAEKQENPFADEESTKEQIKLSDLYAIMEIRGKGENISAKLINKNGTPFFVRVGTTLQTGQVIDEITTTYVSASKDGVKDFLYFSSGGILDQEPVSSDVLSGGTMQQMPQEQPQPQGPVVSSGIPGLATEMMVR